MCGTLLRVEKQTPYKLEGLSSKFRCSHPRSIYRRYWERSSRRPVGQISTEKERRIVMASTAAVPFWRSAGMTYISYSNICASLVRNCLKEPYKSEAISREKVHFSSTKWTDGKPEKPSNFLSLF